MPKPYNDNARTELSDLLKEKFGEEEGRALFVEFIKKLDDLGDAEREFGAYEFERAEKFGDSRYPFQDGTASWAANCNLVESVIKMIKGKLSSDE